MKSINQFGDDGHICHAEQPPLCTQYVSLLRHPWFVSLYFVISIQLFMSNSFCNFPEESILFSLGKL